MNDFQNTHLTPYTEPFHKGLPVMHTKGPLALEYLERLHKTIKSAVGQYSRVFAVRFDLRFPSTMDFLDEYQSNSIIQEFIASLNSKNEHSQERAKARGSRVHKTRLRYCWAREYSQEGRPHYHFLLLLNRDTYFTLGNIHSNQGNLLGRIQEAWASALGMDWIDACRTVHIPQNPSYPLTRQGPDFDHHSINGLSDLYYRASYLCKLRSKRFGNGTHGFGCSRG